MTAVPTPHELAGLPDTEIQQLATQWRNRAAHGVRDAFGIAHAFEVEARRRARELRPAADDTASHVPQRTWWQALVSTPRNGASLSPSHP